MKTSSLVVLALTVALSAAAAPVLGAVVTASLDGGKWEAQAGSTIVADPGVVEAEPTADAAPATAAVGSSARPVAELSDKAMDGVRYHNPIADAAGSEAALMGAPAPLTYDHNHSHNGSVGSGTWDWTNHTLTVTAGNFSWHGINCSWEAFTWTKGDDLLDLINITCDFWGLFTLTFANGNGTITWSNGSFNWSWGAPPAPPEGFDAELMRSISGDPAIAELRLDVAPVQMPYVPAPKF